MHILIILLIAIAVISIFGKAALQFFGVLAFVFVLFFGYIVYKSDTVAPWGYQQPSLSGR